MKPVFQPAQLADLRELQTACKARGIDVAIIGAMAYRFFMEDLDRETYDIDLAAAIDLEDLDAFRTMLAGLGWTPDPRQEQRWRTARGTLIGLLPAGPALRARRRIEWPRSGLVMTLACFDHVFRDSVDVALSAGLHYKVIPPAVLTLLKMAAYLDEPHRRAKDFIDLQQLLRRYESDSPRLFSDEVFQADLPDIEVAGAFLLGRDVAAIATGDDLDLVARFLTQIEPRLEHRPALDFEGRQTARLRGHLAAFRRGLKRAEY